MSTPEHPIQFEQATVRLEEIVERLDDPATGLEEMISLVEEGLTLIRRSRDLLNKAELRIRTLEEPAPETAPEPVSAAPAADSVSPLTNDEFDFI